MSTAPTHQELAGWVRDAAERALQLVADLSDEQLMGPLLPTVKPLIWEIGHLAWFQEKFVLSDAWLADRGGDDGRGHPWPTPC